MPLIHVPNLTNKKAMRYAARVLSDLADGAPMENVLCHRRVPVDARAAVREITQAHQAGWFPVPAGRDLTYSKAQFSRLTDHTSAAPWVVAVQVEAQAFEAWRARHIPQGGYSYAVERLPNLFHAAQAAGTRLPRLPIDHRAGAITLDLWVQVLQDTYNVAAGITSQIRALQVDWMWKPDGDLQAQTNRLQEHGCLHLLPAYVSTTRNRRLDRFERQLLDEVRYRGRSIKDYKGRLNAHTQALNQEARDHWIKVYGQIAQLADALDEARSYKQGPLNKHLNQVSAGRFRIHRSGVNSEALVADLSGVFSLGAGLRIGSPFELAMYCQALADEIPEADPSFEAFYGASTRALERVRLLVSEGGG